MVRASGADCGRSSLDQVGDRSPKRCSLPDTFLPRLLANRIIKLCVQNGEAGPSHKGAAARQPQPPAGVDRGGRRHETAAGEPAAAAPPELPFVATLGTRRGAAEQARRLVPAMRQLLGYPEQMKSIASGCALPAALAVFGAVRGEHDEEDSQGAPEITTAKLSEVSNNAGCVLVLGGLLPLPLLHGVELRVNTDGARCVVVV
jgi:hypothetical protein